MRLAVLRLERGLTQAQMAASTGISAKSYWRLENGQMTNPPVRYLSNCALVLGVPLDDVIEDEWRAWTAFDPSTPAPSTDPKA